VRTPGFAAAASVASKRRAYRQESSALPFMPMTVKSFGRLGAPALTLLGDMADQAVQAGGPGLSRAAFVSGALRELDHDHCVGCIHGSAGSSVDAIPRVFEATRQAVYADLIAGHFSPPGKRVKADYVTQRQ
jgi:hypothetical protein